MSRVPARVRVQVFARDGFTCVYCRNPALVLALNIDHVIPVSAGGSDGMDNLVTACAACNRRKAATIHPAFWDRPDVQAAMARRLVKCMCPACGRGLSDGGAIDDGRTKAAYCGFRWCDVGFYGMVHDDGRAAPLTPEQIKNPDSRWVIQDGSRPQTSHAVRA